MGSKSNIDWTDASWNPIRGCSRVSSGCESCYAEGIAARFSLPERFDGKRRLPAQAYHGFATMTDHGPRWTRRVELVPKHLDDPLRWREPKKIFVNSTSDLFHEALTNEEIAAVHGIMLAARRHTFQALTKRSRRLREWHVWLHRAHPDDVGKQLRCLDAAAEVMGRNVSDDVALPGWPLPNVWIGCSVEDQQRAEERIPDLLNTPAAIRFVSYEPALGAVDFTRVLDGFDFVIDALRGTHRHHSDGPTNVHRGPGLSWVIVGGESGPQARRFDVEWGRDVVRQCRNAGVPCFWKQFGLRPYDSASPGADLSRITSEKGNDPAEWPSGDWPRDFPKAPS